MALLPKPSGDADAAFARPVPPGARTEQIVRWLSRIGQYYTLVVYGLLAFGLAVIGGPGILVAAIGGPSENILLEALAILGALALALLGIYTAATLCHQRILHREFDGARLPLLWMAVGNLGAAAVGGVLQVTFLTAVGVIGGTLYFVLFVIVDRRVLGPSIRPERYGAIDPNRP